MNSILYLKFRVDDIYSVTAYIFKNDKFISDIVNKYNKKEWLNESTINSIENTIQRR